MIRNDLERQFRTWQNRALKMARELAERDPVLAAEPAVQFPLAAIHRQQTVFLKSDEIYRRFVERGTVAGWSQAASGEIWLSNPVAVPTNPTTPCGFASERPLLDGVRQRFAPGVR